MAKIFITGIAGFLGSHIADRMLQLGHNVSGNDTLLGGELDNIPKNVKFHNTDCNDFNKMSDIMKGTDIVYHCAATAYEGLSVFSPCIVTHNIVGASMGTITAAIKNNVGRIVLCSSMARYGTNKVPFTEDMEPRPQDPYGIGKVTTELMLKNLCQVHDIPWVIAVPHNIVGPRQRYCMASGSLVKTTNGFKTIEDLNITDRILIGNLTSRIVDHFSLGQQQSYNITLSNGQILTVSKDHKFKILQQDQLIWKSIDKISPGEAILSEIKQIPDINRESIDFRFGQFLGLLISDGSYNAAYQIDIACCIEKDKPDIRKLFDSLVTEQQIPKYKENKRGVFSIYSREFVLKLQNLGLKAVVHNKIIPAQLLNTSHETVCGILSGLYSGDGWICTKTNHLGYASVSKTLVQQMQKILLSYGINAKLSKRLPKEHFIEDRLIKSDPIFYLTVTGDNVERFNKIGFVYQRKQTILKSKINIKESDIFPNLGEYIKSISHFLPLSVRILKPNCINTPHTNITRFSLKEITSLLDDWLHSSETQISSEYTHFIQSKYNTWSTLLNSGSLITINNIEKTNALLYDISLADSHHSYVGDGFINHNCDPFRNVASIMINLMLQGRQPVIYGDGQQKRCFSFIQDDIGVLEKLAFEDCILGEIINIGPDEEFVTILQLAETIADLLNFKLEPIFMPGRPQEVKLANCSADKARKLLGYSTKWTLRDGLSTMIQYIQERGPKPFNYHLPVELITEKTPKTWTQRLF